MFMYGLQILSKSVQEFKKKSPSGIGGMDVYTEKHISNLERNTNENVWLD